VSTRTHYTNNNGHQVCGEGSSTINGIVPKPKTAGAAALAGDKKQPTPKTPAPKDKGTSTPKEKESAAHTKRINGFLFLRELFEMAKGLQMAHQMSFFRALSSVGLFAILEVPSPSRL